MIVYYAQELAPGVVQVASFNAPDGTPLPAGAVEITRAQYAAVQASPGGWALIDGVLTQANEPTEEP